ncbi:hypothetical protein MA16_Dca024349 [Dendrobium catenatum]|uniref:Uncharacterized protein n=1 Tax=Dendrobium catenatum TaxID=906689 RepID=A0A2I0WVI1_9ASPA|nr:hypothetical protein MA16_Dca024349 [Dendrobium catenatum]
MRETEGSFSKKPTSELSGVGFIRSYKQTHYLIPTARQIPRPTPTCTLTTALNHVTSPSSPSMYSDTVNILLYSMSKSFYVAKPSY